VIGPTGATGASGATGPQGATGTVGPGGEPLFTQTNNLIYPYPVVNRSLALGSTTFTPADNPSTTATNSALIMLNGDNGNMWALGSVGIGTTTPGYNLEIKNTADAAIYLQADSDNVTETDNAFIKFSQDGTAVQAILGTVGGAGFDPENVAYTDTIDNTTLFGTTTAYPLQLGTNDAVRLTILSAGNIGIGTTGPNAPLHVNGDIRATRYLDSDNGSGTNWYIDPMGTNSQLSGDIKLLGSIKIGSTAAPAYAIDMATGKNTINSVDALTISSGGNIILTPGGGSPEVNVGGGGAGKINVGTVDPPYTIGSGRYATYMPSMVGIKEETTGVVNTTENVPGIGYRSVIDFGRLTPGTDLWLFSKTTDLKTNIDKLVVILNPSGNTRAWYDLDVANYRLAIYTSQPSRVSYRFTAPRFDYQQWQNTRTNTIAGFNISGLTAISPSDIPLVNPSVNALTDLNITNTSTPSTGLMFDLKDSVGTFIYDVGRLSQAAIANLKAGWLQVDTITPLSSGSSGITMKLGSNQQLKIADTNGTPTTTFDSLGNATLSGQLTTKDIVVNQNATFNGNLIQTNGINAIPDQGSIVPNSGFEVNSNASSMPDTWSCVNTGTSTGSCTRDTTAFNQGSASLAITKTNTTSQTQFVSGCFPVTSENRYNVNMRVVGSGPLSPSQFFIGLWGYTNKTDCTNNANATEYQNGHAVATSWSTLSETTPLLGSSITWARAGGYITNIAGTVNVDALRVTPNQLTRSMDIAENYYVSSPLASGTLVEIAQNNASGVEKATAEANRTMIGIVSTNPAMILGDGIANENMLTPIALTGRIPAIVSSQNGVITNGDAITGSTLAGVGTKAIDSGVIVGKALEPFAPSDATCQEASSLDAIPWPQDDGTNSAKPCFKLPDGTYVGKIMVFANVGWFEPEVQNEVKTKTLYADRIITSGGELTATGSAQTINTYITNITQIASSSATPTVDLTPTLDASTAALLASLSQSVSSLTAQNIDLTGKSITASTMTLHDSLSVLGNTTLGETSIAGSLLVDASIRISDTGIETISEPLYLNKSKFANVDIMNGALVITTSGDVIVSGNLTVKGILGASTIRPTVDNLTLSLEHTTASASSESGFGKLIVKGKEAHTVEFDEQGNIIASGSATVARLNITNMMDTLSTQSAVASSSATIGSTILGAGQTELTVFTNAVTDKSLIYVTPQSSTNNQVLYVTTKTPGIGFTVNIDAAINKDVKFNWWIVN
jgi:hypothetical protein